jgi:polyisoprenoid-binding protein YceI
LDAVFNSGQPAWPPYFEKPVAGFSATTTIKRSDWGLSNSIPFVGDEVKVELEGEYHQKA